MRIRVVGKADRAGPTDYNQRLSERRANNVRQLLTQMGVSPNQIEAVGVGEIVVWRQPDSDIGARFQRVAFS